MKQSFVTTIQSAQMLRKQTSICAFFHTSKIVVVLCSVMSWTSTRGKDLGGEFVT